MQEDNTLKEVARSARETPSANLWVFYLIIFLFILTIAFLFVYYKFLREPLQRGQRRKAVFNRFSTVNELNINESNYLKYVATQYQLPNLYLIFVKRSVFEEAAGKIVGSGVEISTLRDKLYRSE